jgi:phosphatidylserine/phosphatidylglycerophosphate/cardiolipin synthase-like enzyme
VIRELHTALDDTWRSFFRHGALDARDVAAQAHVVDLDHGSRRQSEGRSLRFQCLGSPYLVHAKVWIFDDEFAVIGSANIDRRSYTYNTELSIAICDTRISDGHDLVKQLRVDLWEKHLNGQELDAEQKPIRRQPLVTNKRALDDFSAAADLWNQAPLLQRIDLENNYPADRDFIDDHQAELTQGRLSWLKKFIAKYGALHGRENQWDNIIDPDGTQ